MGFRDYNASAANNTALAGIYTGPNMAREDVDNSFRQIMADAKAFANEFSATVALGELPAGTTVGVTIARSFSGHSGGTTDFRNTLYQTTLTGANSVAEVDQVTAQLELTHSAGTLTSAFGRKAYARLGLSGSTTGAVTSIRVYDTHVANEGTGAITNATCYFADAVDLADGTGAITNMVGFYAGNQGHATRVTAKAVGFRAANMTSGATFTAAFYSEMQAGTGRYAFYDEGGAPSIFIGKVGIGSATPPVDGLELFQGYAKLCGSTTKLADGSYHEMRSANGTYLAKLTNSHATTPDGIHIKFTGAFPNNTTQRFLLLDDTATTRFEVFSSGLTNSLVGYQVAGSNVVGTRKTGWTAPTGTATRTGFATGSATTQQVAEALKALIDDLTSHGLIGT